METFIVNGKTYREKPEKEQKQLPRFMAIAMMMYGVSPFIGSKKLRDPYYVIEHYKLILNKKCPLSRSERDNIVYLFNKHFEEVKENENTNTYLARTRREHDGL